MRAESLIFAIFVALATVGSGYEFITGVELSWGNAQAACQAQFGLDLAKIETLDDVREFAAWQASFENPNHIWIGAQKDFSGATTSHWVDGSPVVTHFWRQGEPNIPGELCIHMWVGHTQAQIDAGEVWNDARCNEDARWWAGCGVSTGVFPTPQCEIPPSEWLETAFAPILDVDGSGFTTGASDVFRFSFDYHQKYYNEVFSTGADASLQTVATAESAPADASLGPCYDNIHLDILWGDLVPFCSRDDTSDPEFVIYTCKVIADGTEALDPIRGEGLERDLHNEIPVQVRFPKQVSASVSDLSAFRAPDLQAAVVRQEVNVDVSDLGVVAKVRLFTSVQYPYRLDTPVWPDSADIGGASHTPTGISPGVAPVSITDCGPPYPAGGDSPGAPGDEFACNQVWELDLAVAGGANPANSVCELDGGYYFQWTAECVPTFPSDCPLVPDDLGQVNDEYVIQFTLDSEYFCPTVVDEVDVSASLAVFKAADHSVAATNFILGQTLYVVATVSSNKVTVVGAQLDDLRYDRGAGSVDVVVDEAALVPPAIDANDQLQALAWYNSGETDPASGLTVPANEVWFQFLVSSPPFLPPVDGSEDFSLSATLNVDFKDAGPLLLQADGTRSGKFGASTDSKVSDQEEASAAVGLRDSKTTMAIAALGMLPMLV